MKQAKNKSHGKLLQFGTVRMADVPHSRAGKHSQIVALLLSELDELDPGAAIKVPLDRLGDTKANVRSALNRASRKAGRTVATAADKNFLYVWNVDPEKGQRSQN
jgi:hypothetical protein